MLFRSVEGEVRGRVAESTVGFTPLTSVIVDPLELMEYLARRYLDVVHT